MWPREAQAPTHAPTRGVHAGGAAKKGRPQAPGESIGRSTRRRRRRGRRVGRSIRRSWCCRPSCCRLSCPGPCRPWATSDPRPSLASGLDRAPGRGRAGMEARVGGRFFGLTTPVAILVEMRVRRRRDVTVERRHRLPRRGVLVDVVLVLALAGSAGPARTQRARAGLPAVRWQVGSWCASCIASLLWKWWASSRMCRSRSAARMRPHRARPREI